MGFLSKEQIADVKEDIKGDDRFLRLNSIDDNSTLRIRLMGEAITGWEVWVEEEDDDNNKADKKLRFEEKPDELPENAKADMSGKKEYKRFIASIVWDYKLEKFRLLDLTQPGAMGQIFALDDDPDYGNPTGYDLKITKTVKGKKTSYGVTAAPPKEVAPSIAKAFKALQYDLSKMFDGEDPWEVETSDK